MSLVNLISRMALISMLAFSVMACEDNNAEEVGETVDEVITDAGNKVEDLCEDVKEKADAEDKDC